MPRIVTEVDAQDIMKAAHEQPRTDQEDHGKTCLHHEHRIARERASVDTLTHARFQCARELWTTRCD